METDIIGLKILSVAVAQALKLLLMPHHLAGSRCFEELDRGAFMKALEKMCPIDREACQNSIPTGQPRRLVSILNFLHHRISSYHKNQIRQWKQRQNERANQPPPPPVPASDPNIKVWKSKKQRLKERIQRLFCSFCKENGHPVARCPEVSW